LDSFCAFKRNRQFGGSGRINRRIEVHRGGLEAIGIESMKKSVFQTVIITCFFVWVAQCTSVPIHKPASHVHDIPVSTDRSVEMEPAQEYAGEILSYLMQVVLGKSGNPKWKTEWATRGIEEKLDFGNIKDVMSDPERNKTALIVHDMNIFGLSEVLYYYDNKLNQFKGESNFNSIYPAPELIAVRILLLKKIHQGEKVNIRSLFELDYLLNETGSAPKAEELEDVNLTFEELQFLRDAIWTEPHFKTYMEHPFLVAALYQTGAIEKDEFVEKMIQEANYKKYPCRLLAGKQDGAVVKISFLPSMIDQFRYGKDQQISNEQEFKPTDFYRQMLDRLKNTILTQTKQLLEKDIPIKQRESKTAGQKEWEVQWEKIAKEKIAFYTQDQRPLVIYPENAGQVIEDVCPEADFSIIILGKNVYLSLFLDKEKDIYPAKNRIYLDIIDLKYHQVEDEIDQISRFIASRLGKDIGKMRQ
jgi:hypothetical protein